ncbi:MAG: PEP-CTERM sorting domain-containing protein, partial [Bryobacteraceae bacterium]|nr:PEP-CTERM sorting domain-containing protein [Bryobacteraceae bacterium]
LAASEWSMNRGSIWDISQGGNFNSTEAWASNLPGSGDSLFEVVPALVAPQPPVTAAVPEPGTLALAGLGLLYIARRIRIARS